MCRRGHRLSAPWSLRTTVVPHHHSAITSSVAATDPRSHRTVLVRHRRSTNPLSTPVGCSAPAWCGTIAVRLRRRPQPGEEVAPHHHVRHHCGLMAAPYSNQPTECASAPLGCGTIAAVPWFPGARSDFPVPPDLTEHHRSPVVYVAFSGGKDVLRTLSVRHHRRSRPTRPATLVASGSLRTTPVRHHRGRMVANPWICDPRVAPHCCSAAPPLPATAAATAHQRPGCSAPPRCGAIAVRM